MLVQTLGLLAILGGAFAGRFLDQSQSGVVTTYQIPSQGVWQSFTPKWNSTLSEIDIYFGAANPATCVPYVGTLTIYAGEGNSDAPYFESSQILQQEIQGSCKCNAKDCFAWEQYVLTTPVHVLHSERYSFMISGPASGILYRVGVSVADVYQRGINDFPVPGYDYAFQTFLSTPSGDSSNTASTQPPVGGVQPDSSTTDSSTVGIVVGSVLGVFCVLVIIALVVIKRRKTRGSVDTNEWLSVAQATAELKNRFGGVDHFSDSAIARYHRRHVSSFDSIIKETATTSVHLDDHDNVVSYVEPAVMGDKPFVWDGDAKKLKTAKPSRAEDEDIVDMPADYVKRV